MFQQPILMWGLAAEKRSQAAKAKPKAPKAKAKAKAKMKAKDESNTQQSVFGALQLKEEQEEEEYDDYDDDPYDGIELDADGVGEQDEHQS